MDTNIPIPSSFTIPAIAKESLTKEDQACLQYHIACICQILGLSSLPPSTMPTNVKSSLPVQKSASDRSPTVPQSQPHEQDHHFTTKPSSSSTSLTIGTPSQHLDHENCQHAVTPPTKLSLLGIKKKANESFDEYASRWFKQAIRVRPSTDSKEMSGVFILAEDGDYYQHLSPMMGKSFSEVLKKGNVVEEGLKSGLLVSSAESRVATLAMQVESSEAIRKMKGDKEKFAEGVVAPLINHVQYQQASFQSKYPTFPYHSAPIQPPLHHLSSSFELSTEEDRRLVITLLESLESVFGKLFNKGMLGVKDQKTPYNAHLDASKRYMYHSYACGHDTEDCLDLKRDIQKVIDKGLVKIDLEPLPTNHPSHLPHNTFQQPIQCLPKYQTPQGNSVRASQFVWESKPSRIFIPSLESQSGIFEKLQSSNLLCPVQAKAYVRKSKSFDPMKHCTFHSNMLGHDTNHCTHLKNLIQDFIYQGYIKVEMSDLADRELLASLVNVDATPSFTLIGLRIVRIKAAIKTLAQPIPERQRKKGHFIPWSAQNTGAMYKGKEKAIEEIGTKKHTTIPFVWGNKLESSDKEFEDY